MALSYYDFREFEDLLDDEMIDQAIYRLKERRKDFANWIKDNDPLQSCPECGSENAGYEWNKRLCKDCGYKEDYQVPMPHEGGKSASRELYQIIKELFGSKMGQERHKHKPKKKDLKNMPIHLSDFNTGEYTNSQIEFLEKRYKQYENSIGTLEPNDEFMISALVKQELKVFMISREEIVNPNSISSTDKKREIDLLVDLAQEIKSTKSTRTNDEEKSAFNNLYEQFKGESIDSLLESYEEKKKEREEQLKKSKKARKDAGNPY
ncbi:MAG: hypothetical protein ACOCZ5_00995 [bacterium]